MKMKREEKSSLVSALTGQLESADGVFVVENRGVTVAQMEKLRRELGPITSVFRVIKNRLFKLAVKDTQFSEVSELMHRPTAVAIATDPLAVAKVLAKFAETHPNVVIKGGKMDVGLLNAEDVFELSKLPSLLEIRGTIARILVEPASRLARVAGEYGKKN